MSETEHTKLRDTLKIEVLLAAIDNYVEAAGIERRAREEYTGSSWGYHGSSYINDRAYAAIAVEDALFAVIDSRAALGAK